MKVEGNRPCPVCGKILYEEFFEPGTTKKGLNAFGDEKPELFFQCIGAHHEPEYFTEFKGKQFFWLDGSWHELNKPKNLIGCFRVIQK